MYSKRKTVALVCLLGVWNVVWYVFGGSKGQDPRREIGLGLKGEVGTSSGVTGAVKRRGGQRVVGVDERSTGAACGH